MDPLPAELLMRMCSELGVRELRNIRLTCWALARVSEPFLFSVAIVRTIKKGHENLTAISRHSRLFAYVKQIVYGYDLFDTWGERQVGEPPAEKWAAGYERSASLLPYTGVFCTPPEQSKDREEYYGLRTSERVKNLLWVQDNEIKSFISAFRRMPNLTTVTCKPIDHMLQWGPLDTMNESLHLQLPWVVDADHGYDPSASLRQVAILDAANQVNLNLKSFESIDVSLDTFRLPSSCLATMNHAVRNTVHLSLSFKCLIGTVSTPDIWEGIGRFLAAAPNLQTFDLSTGCVYVSNIVYQIITLGEILEYRSHWTSLRCLNFSGLATRRDTLVEFLKIHAPTLRSLALQNLWFYPVEEDNDRFRADNWAHISEAIRRSLTLDSLSVSGDWAEEV